MVGGTVLTPAFWRQTIAQPDTQRRLDANIYRRASLTPINSSLAVGNAAGVNGYGRPK
jgi:hypothetical protein